MFPNRYYGSRYYPTRYFPKVGDDPTIVETTFPVYNVIGYRLIGSCVFLLLMS